MIRHCEEILAKKSQKRQKVDEFTKTFHWFFTDIVKSSDPTIPTKEQLEKIQKFYEILSKTKMMRKRDSNRILVPTGDGYVVAFSDSPEKPLLLAIDLLKGIEKYNKKISGKRKLSLRVGLDSGPVFIVKDFNNKNTFWGPGIITAKRVMDAGIDNHILASKQFADNTSVLRKEYKSFFHPIGEYVTKHGKQIEICNVYGKDFGNKIFPRKDKIMKTKESDNDRRTTSNFKFKKIAINLDVTDSKTMMTHHTWIWDVVNISRDTQPQILYQLGGDKEREFSDLNVKITDAGGKNLEIVRIDVNKPTYKEFFVKLKRPIKPRHELKHLKLEYDWEESDREFVYVLPTDCRTFSYKLTIPEKLVQKVRIFQRVGFSEKKPLEPAIKHKNKKMEISWEGKNLKAHDEYSLQW